MSDVCLHSRNQARIFRGGVQVRGSATHFSRPTPILAFANCLWETRPSSHIGPVLCTPVETAFRETPSSTSVYKHAAGHYYSSKRFIVIFGYSPSVEGGGFLRWCMAYPVLGAILL